MYHCIKIYDNDGEFQVTYLDQYRKYHSKDLISTTEEEAIFEVIDLLDCPETAIEIIKSL